MEALSREIWLSVVGAAAALAVGLASWSSG